MIRFVVLLLGFLTYPALAHKNSDSYLRIDTTHSPISLQWSIAIRDINTVLPLDNNRDGDVTWGELRSARTQVFALAFKNLSLHASDTRCRFGAKGMQVDKLSDGQYAVLRFAAACPEGKNLKLDYQLLFEQDPNHRGLINAKMASGEWQSVLSPSSSSVALTKQRGSAANTAWRFFREGVWHIWIGFDHLLFLFTLLLPAVMVYRQRRWQPAERASDAVKAIAAIVTAFTVAHSLTLSAAALGWLSLPSRWVEATIAASIVVVALNNLRPIAVGKTWLLAFILGLIHGFGFAGVLGDLGLEAGNLIVPLLSFNVGVEAGQLAVVALLMPLAWWLRKHRLYRYAGLIGGSLFAAAIGVYWCVERLA